MKRNLLFLLALGAFLASGTLTSVLMAQGAPGAGVQPTQNAANPQPQANKPIIAVVAVDYLYLMDIHPQLFAERNALNQQFKATGELFRKEYEKLQNMQREIDVITPGTQEYSVKMEAARKFKSDVDLRAIKDQEEFQIKGLNIEYQAYQEIKNMVERYAVANNILVVINHVDIARRLPEEKTVDIKELELTQMSTVVWVNPLYDITQAIENWLNDTYEKKGFQAVNYKQLIEQKFGSRSANGGTQQPQTNVAAGPGQVGRN